MATDDRFTEKYAEIIRKAAQFLCNSYHDGRWGPTKTTAMTIWALHECGVGVVEKHAEKHKEIFIEALYELIEKEGTEIHKGLSFDEEIWETSVVLIALAKVDRQVFKDKIESIKKWLLSQLSESGDNFNDEPWETMWVLTALFESNEINNDDWDMVRNCITWILDKKNAQGILISLHYMGFLLAVLNYALRDIKSLDGKEIKIYQDAIEDCKQYLVNEFHKNKKAGMLWSSEPWSVGHILHGITESPMIRETIFKDEAVNEHIIKWYKDNWRTLTGFGSVKNTCDTLVGLMRYYLCREVEYRKADQSHAIARISEKIVLEDEEVRRKKTVVYPLWGKGVEQQEREVCLVMPFKDIDGKQPFGKLVSTIRNLLQDEEDMIVTRADDEKTAGDAIEKIWRFINAANVVIVDITDTHANVMYELGIAHTLGKKVIILTQDDPNTIPFDLKCDVIKYDVLTGEGRTDLRRNIRKGIEEAFNKKRKRI